MKNLLSIFFVCLASVTWGADTMLYQLQQTATLKNGGKYVLVQDNAAIDANISNKALQVTTQYATTGLTGNETYVWTLEHLGQIDNNYYLKSNLNLQYAYYLGNAANSTDLSLEYEPSKATCWLFTLENNVFKIANGSRVLGYTFERNAYKAYILGNDCGHAITIYQLVPSSYARTEIASNQIGTVCLPFATEAYSGATFYTLSCKENDAQGNPVNVFYEEVTGQLEAGKPYVYVPDNDAAALSFTAAEGSYVSKPNNYNGFVGTFADVVDDTKTHTLEGNYIIYNNQFQKCGTNCGLRAYRAYIKMSEVAEINQVAAPTRRLLVMGQGKEPEYMDPTPGVMTEIQKTVYTMHSAVTKAECAMLNGRIVIIRGGEHYDMTGRRVE